MKKIILCCLCFVLSIIKVNALENDSNVTIVYLNDIHSNRIVDGKTYSGKQGIVYVNGNIGYCLDATILLKNNVYSSSLDFGIVNFTDEQLHYLELVSYFGYGYENRTDDYYYLATQELVWEYLTGGEVYWTNAAHTVTIDIENYKNSILKSIEEYLKEPNISQYIESFVGDEATLTDFNNVLKYYQTGSPFAQIKDNKLHINTEYAGTTTITLTKRNLNSNVSYLYTSNGSQSLATFGFQTNNTKEINITSRVIKQSKLKVIKKDSITGDVIKKRQTQIKILNLQTNEYLKVNNNEILTIDESGELLIDIWLKEGNYQLEEITPPNGYYTLEEPMIFTIYEYSPDRTEIEIKNNPIHYFLQVEKKGEIFVGLENNQGMYEDILLSDVIYGLYADEILFNVLGETIYDKNQLVTEIHIQDGYGYIGGLSYGKYYLKELSCPEEYELNKALTIVDFTEENNFISLSFENKLKKGNIIFSKYGEEKPLEGAEIAFYDSNKEEILKTVTNKKGNIVLHNIPNGTYYFQEKTSPIGYILDNNMYKLELTGEKLEYIFENELEEIIPDEIVEEKPLEPIIEEQPENPETADTKYIKNHNNQIQLLLLIVLVAIFPKIKR